MTRTRTRTFAVDEACAAAAALARQAAEEIARPGEVGEHLGFEGEGERVVTHYFASLDRAYHGWRWAVTVTRASRARNVTVSETVLLPGAGALLAPSWVPWSQRLRPGDLGVGDLLPAEDDDERLAPGFTETDEDSDRQMIFEFGLGRARVLSALGRDLAVRRWHSGESGPDTPLAHAAPAQCSTCGFYWPLAGALRLGFGVCANEFAPDDGRVVAADHGCGAHSEATTAPPMVVDQVPPILDDLGYDDLRAHDPAERAEAVEPAEPADAVEPAGSDERTEIAETPEAARAARTAEIARAEEAAEVAERTESTEPAEPAEGPETSLNGAASSNEAEGAPDIGANASTAGSAGTASDAAAGDAADGGVSDLGE